MTHVGNVTTMAKALEGCKAAVIACSVLHLVIGVGVVVVLAEVIMADVVSFGYMCPAKSEVGVSDCLDS